jgi:hypothetical protein
MTEIPAADNCMRGLDDQSRAGLNDGYIVIFNCRNYSDIIWLILPI